jgi:hypothetical protein
MTETTTQANAATIQNLALRQIMASFAYLAYCGQGITTPSPEAEILKLINDAIPRIPPLTDGKPINPKPLWKVVWGPGVFTMPGALYQDNMMFVAQSLVDTTQYVIAVRGTNFISDLDWLMEDFDILQMIPWSTLQNAAISESTSIDLNILWAIKPPTNVLGAGKTFREFLKGETSRFPSGINLCVTGHSLGGCVGGTLALALKEGRASWDNKSGNSRVCSITFAAPTAGNAAFATYSDQQFAGQGGFPGWDQTLGTNFDAVRCSYDVAPLAWTAKAVALPGGGNLPKLLTVYGNNLNFLNMDFSTYLAFSGAVAFISPILVNILTPRNYQQVVSAAECLPGVFNNSLAPPTNGLEDYLNAFVEQAEYQHGSSYPALLSVPELNDPNIIVTHLLSNKRRANKPSGKTVKELLQE